MAARSAAKPSASAAPTKTGSQAPAQKGTQGQGQSGQTTSQQQRTWIKNHPLEGDGLITGFYNFLHKRNAKTLKACKDVLVPDTIVYDHNFPRGWFTSDLKSKEISKKQGKELDAASIVGAFHATPNPNVTVVASYMCSYEEEDPATGESNTITNVEFFNERTLDEFVARKEKREGILQKFVVPKGLRNGVIQAVWSPRVCIVQRRTNRNSINDHLQCDKDPYPCAVTYEGPDHYSEEGSCALHTTDQIKTICTSIVQHFFATEHKVISRMVLYFKVDEKDQVWLLWCGSLRVDDRDQPSQMPLDLAPKFSSPSLEGGIGGSKPSAGPEGEFSYDDECAGPEDPELREADRRYCAMVNDTLFMNTYVKKNNKPHQRTQSPRGTVHEEGGTQDGSDAANVKAGRKNGGGKSSTQAKPKGEEADEDDEDPSWHNLPGIQDQYRELCIDREQAIGHFDDVFYEAYGHFLRHEPGPFVFEVDRRVGKALGVDMLQEMMQSLKIEHALSTEETTSAASATAGGAHNPSSIEDEELTFSIPAKHNLGPMTKVGEAAKKWVRGFYARRIRELREEAQSMPPQPAGGAAAAQPHSESSPPPATEEHA